MYLYHDMVSLPEPIDGDVAENEYIRLWRRDGLLYAVFKPSHITQPIAEECTNFRVAYCNGRDYKALIDGRNIKTVSKEARDYFAMPESSVGIIAAAFLIRDALGRITGNFVIKISRPIIPSQLFTDIEKAQEWLENQ